MSLVADVRLEIDTRLHIDAAAALGILERRGVGRIRHLDVGTLWLQEVQLRQKVSFMKVKGTYNPADLMTKHLPQDTVSEYMEKLGFEFGDGRSKAKAQLHAAASPASSSQTLHPRGPATTRLLPELLTTRRRRRRRRRRRHRRRDLKDLSEKLCLWMSPRYLLPF